MKVYFNLLCLLLIIGLFQNCNSFHENKIGQNENPSLSLNSISIFESTAFVVLRNNCASCHGINQPPLFAVSDSATALSTLINGNLVSFGDPRGSSVVLKIENGHQSFPTGVAVELADAIQDWVNQVNTSGGTGTNPNPNPSPNPNPNPGPLTASALAFEASLYPVVRQNCAGCHGVNQFPLFALTDIQQAHDNIINGSLVNFTTPGNSTLVQKIQANHQTIPVAIANDLQLAIEEWLTALSGTGPPPPTIQLTSTFSSIHQLILIPKCASCHSPNGTRPQEDYSSYASTIQTGGIAIGNADGSEMYKECVSGSMPEGASNLSGEELTVIRDWINQGALDN